MEAAAAVEAGTFAVETLDGVARVRVLQTMARLKQQVQELGIETDEVKKAQVAEITETGFFRDLCQRAEPARVAGIGVQALRIVSRKIPGRLRVGQVSCTAGRSGGNLKTPGIFFELKQHQSCSP